MTLSVWETSLPCIEVITPYLLAFEPKNWCLVLTCSSHMTPSRHLETCVVRVLHHQLGNTNSDQLQQNLFSSSKDCWVTLGLRHLSQFMTVLTHIWIKPPCIPQNKLVHSKFIRDKGLRQANTCLFCQVSKVHDIVLETSLPMQRSHYTSAFGI